MQVDKNLVFLLGVVETALAHGARPYVPENERDVGGIGSLGVNLVPNGPFPSSLKFEAYERPAVQVPPLAILANPHASAADFEDVQSGPRSPKASSHSISVAPEIDFINPESTRLRLDGVQRKWGRQTYSPHPSSTSTADEVVSRGRSSVSARDSFYDRDGAVTSGSDSVTGKKQQLPVSSAKTKLAASLFGGSPASHPNSTGSGGRLPRSAPKGHTGRGHPKDHPSTVPSSGTRDKVDVSSDKAVPLPPPDLLDFNDDNPAGAVPASDPFKLLESRVDPELSDPMRTEVSAQETELMHHPSSNLLEDLLR